jgi:response regulator NasT
VRILLADDNAERARAVAHVLAADPGLIVLHHCQTELLADAVTALKPDIVLVDMARPDRDALEGIRQVTTHQDRPVVLFVDEDDPSFMEEAILAGVSSYNVLDVPLRDVKPILRAAMALFQRHQQDRDRMHKAESRLLERETVDRAKAILIRDRRLNEPEAYGWLRRQAMTRGQRIAEVAKDVVRGKEGSPA